MEKEEKKAEKEEAKEEKAVEKEQKQEEKKAEKEEKKIEKEQEKEEKKEEKAEHKKEEEGAAVAAGKIARNSMIETLLTLASRNCCWCCGCCRRNKAKGGDKTERGVEEPCFDP